MAPTRRSAMEWARANNPFSHNRPQDLHHQPPPPMPHLPAERPRPLTAMSAGREGVAHSLLFTKLPAEVRVKILRAVFGDDILHLELDYRHPHETPATTELNVTTETHANRSSSERRDPFSYKKLYWPACHLRVDERKPKAWRWFSCSCHTWVTPFDGLLIPSSVEPWADRCKFGRNECCPGYARGQCHVAVMGWLLTCHQAYVEGIDVLYSANRFHISNTELLLSLPRLLLPSRLASVTSVELLWKIHPFREQLARDPPGSDHAGFITLMEQTPVILPNLRQLYVSLQGDMMIPGYSIPENNLFTEDVYEIVRRRILVPMEDMLRRFRCLKDAVVAIPSSCYGAQKRHVINNNGVFANAVSTYEAVERLWQDLEEAPDSGLKGYWLQLGHRDLGSWPWMQPRGGCMWEAPPPDEQKGGLELQVLYEQSVSPW